MEAEDQLIRISAKKDSFTGQTIVRATLTFGYDMAVDDNYGEDSEGKDFIDGVLKDKLKAYIRREAMRL